MAVRLVRKTRAISATVLKFSFGYCAGNRREKIFRQEKISGKGIGDPLRRHLVLRPPFIDPANERLPSMVLPMTDFVGE